MRSVATMSRCPGRIASRSYTSRTLPERFGSGRLVWIIAGAGIAQSIREAPAAARQPTNRTLYFASPGWPCADRAASGTGRALELRTRPSLPALDPTGHPGRAHGVPAHQLDGSPANRQAVGGRPARRPLLED